jgi:prevent-host-death family protein
MFAAKGGIDSAPEAWYLGSDQNSGQSEVIPMSKTLPVSEVKARLAELVKSVDGYDEEVVVTRNGRPAAVLVSIGEYRRLHETLDVLCDPGVMRQIKESREYFRKGGKGLSMDEAFHEPVQRRGRKAV